MALTAKQQAFVDEYLKTRNATKAALAAGYSPKTAYSIGSENLKKPEVSEVIRQRTNENAMSADEVAALLAEQARGDMSDFVTFYPGMKLPVLDLQKAYENGKMRLVKKLKFLPDGGVEFELYDAQAAMVQVGKIHKMFTDKNEIGGMDGGPIPILTVQPGAMDKLKP
jgi:phage terminase small subunit